MNIDVKILIVEDELIIANHLKANLIEMGYRVTGIASDYDSAIELIKTYENDLVLIDIKIDSEKSGIDVARYLQENHKYTPFIFLTSFVDAETIGKAKVTNPAGYLSKPFTYNSVYSTIEIALHNVKSLKQEHIITIYDGALQHKLKKSDILFFESEHIYVNIITNNNKIMIRSSLSKIIESLPANSFARVHRSYIVNIGHIKLVAPSYVMVEDYKVPLGRTFKESIEPLLSDDQQDL